MAQDSGAAPSTPSLLAGVVEDVLTLVRHELALAHRELLDELAALRSAVTGLAVAGAVAGAGAAILLLGVAGGLADWFNWPTWAGQALVGLVLLMGGALVYFSARGRLRNFNPKPVEAVKSVKEDWAFLRQRTMAREEHAK